MLKHAKCILVKDRTSPDPDMTTCSTGLPDPNGLIKKEAH